MIKRGLYVVLLVMGLSFYSLAFDALTARAMTAPMKEEDVEKPLKRITLPTPTFDSNTSIEKALLKRRSGREYMDEALTIEEISQLLWAAQGITEPPFYKTAPSAGALYPLELYVVVGNVKDLSSGIYKYAPEGHELSLLLKGDTRKKIYEAALRQSPIRNAPAIIVFSAVFSKTRKKYGERGDKYVYMEAGHAAQNICLQAVSLNLGAVVIGAFIDKDLKEILYIRKNAEPLYLIPVGKM
ncbi:MAG: SagB/ThcOx family dehydrogenase [bacterium]